MTKRKSPSQTTSTKCQYHATPIEGKVVRGREMALHDPQPDDQQHDRADGDVQAVKP